MEFEEPCLRIHAKIVKEKAAQVAIYSLTRRELKEETMTTLQLVGCDVQGTCRSRLQTPPTGLSTNDVSVGMETLASLPE